MNKRSPFGRFIRAEQEIQYDLRCQVRARLEREFYVWAIQTDYIFAGRVVEAVQRFGVDALFNEFYRPINFEELSWGKTLKQLDRLEKWDAEIGVTLW